MAQFVSIRYHSSRSGKFGLIWSSSKFARLSLLFLACDCVFKQPLRVFILNLDKPSFSDNIHNKDYLIAPNNGGGMSGRIVLINPARHFIANEHGLGYLIPLGLVCIGGPLIDAGFSVKLIDHDLYGWSLERLVQKIADFQADYILLGHSGSTAAHKTALRTIQAIHQQLPHLRVVYGGVYPSYADKVVMAECDEIDAIVRGEGEQTILGLIRTWEQTDSLGYVDGVTWRKGEEIIVNRSRTPIKDLDEYRPGWELVDWPRYSMFGFKHAAGLQFSRGCTLTCTYCGQWMFWKKWRHRSPENVVEQLKILKNQYGVKIVWFADENFAADRDVAQQILERIVDADLDLSLNLNMTAADVVRDADLIPL